MRVFLGGTCNDTTWRNELSKLLDTKFNSITKDLNKNYEK